MQQKPNQAVLVLSVDSRRPTGATGSRGMRGHSHITPRAQTTCSYCIPFRSIREYLTPRFEWDPVRASLSHIEVSSVSVEISSISRSSLPPVRCQYCSSPWHSWASTAALPPPWLPDRSRKNNVELRGGQQRDRNGDTSALRRLVRLGFEWY